MSLLRTERLTIEVGDHTVCRELDFTIRAGECWALLGGNGAGKTTLLHSLIGLHTAVHGTIELAGQPLGQLSRRGIAQIAGLLPQDSSDPFPATVLETAVMGRHPHLGPWQWERREDYDAAREALASVDLAGEADRDVRTLSGGERRRLALATLITQAPRLQLLDEPANHLDLHHQVTLLQRFSDPGDGATMMSLHDVNLAERFCSHALLLFGEGDVCYGPTDDVLSADVLSRLYQHPIRQIDDGNRRVFIAD